MYNFDLMPKYSEFQYWFYRDMLVETPTWIAVLKGDEQTAAGTVVVTSNEVECSDEEIKAEFKKFMTRPEFACGDHVQISDTDHQANRVAYETLLAGGLLIRAKKHYPDPDVVIPTLTSMFQWLDGNDLYTAPASTHFHESFAGGLLVHSLKVYNQMIILHQLPHFQGAVTIDEIVITSLTHDWCKIGMYEPYQRNVKNEQTGQWEKVTDFRRNPQGVPMGHGAASMYYISKFTRLEVEEALAIRWHMSAWYCCDSEMNELQQSNEKYPLVHMLQFADQLAITEYAK